MELQINTHQVVTGTVNRFVHVHLCDVLCGFSCSCLEVKAELSQTNSLIKNELQLCNMILTTSFLCKMLLTSSCKTETQVPIPIL
jgi:hypothetical protein